MSSVFCKSEVDTLEKVIVHYPDDGIEVVTPSNALEFLYDDIVHLPVMREEHQSFKDIISAFIGEENVIDTERLLLEVFNTIDDVNKEKFFNHLFKEENLSESVQKQLKTLNNEDLVYTLFTGVIEKEDISILPPLPNYVFTRDIAVVIKDHLLICNPSKKARTREGVLTRTICYFHPMFKSCQENSNAKIIDMTEAPDICTIEGGDVMIFHEDYLLIGCSERTNAYGIEMLGTKGRCDINVWNHHEIKGATNWRWEKEHDKKDKNNMYQTEHDELFASIRNGNPMNDGIRAANSTMLAIWGRMVAYTGKTITWEEALNSQETLGPKVDEFNWDLDWKMADIAKPGATKFI